MSDTPILQVEGLRTLFFTRQGLVRAVSDVSFEVARGEVLAEGPYGTVSKHPAVIEAYVGTGHG